MLPALVSRPRSCDIFPLQETNTSLRVGQRIKERQDMLLDYLYFDMPRIERYFQQLSAPVRYDKVPEWKVALGLTGVSVESSQSRPGRDFSIQEKIDKVLESMESQKIISKGRPASFTRTGEEEIPFASETLTARRVYIEHPKYPLKLWISLRPDEQPKNARPLGTL